MTIMQKLVFNVETGQESLVDFTDAEITQHTKDIETALKNAAENEKIATDKAALLAKLGITDDEAKLLLS